MSAATETKTETATFAAGCFWGVEAEFRQVQGVIDADGRLRRRRRPRTRPTRTSAPTAPATPRSSRSSSTPSEISYDELLDVFLNIHDPTT